MKLCKWIKRIIRIGICAGVVATVVGYVKSLNIFPDYDEHKPNGPYEEYFKRPMDIFISLTAILLLLPVYIAVAVLVKIKLGGPVIFAQERPGLNGEIFKIYKFRSMTNEKDENGELLPDEIRLTEFGKKLRSTSLDELPELFNILKGDMSLIGPRPLLVEYLERYDEEQKHRHDVRPGLTGLAQVNGRFNILWREKFAYDLEYVNNISFFGDLKIFVKTIKVVFEADDVENEKLGSYYPFLGNDVEDQLESERNDD